ncbi:MAG: 4Fe-4S dicluster domain-containing protein [Crenarchaeota archaeon]|nr:4Fe-4S dicluster domain-containing protein [Thermoproteota archaeon]MDW8033867.1 4Fe-4S dicluster domain-containing protein [Nitrososphaerota archaeon]
MSSSEKELRRLARRLLETEVVQLVIGYEESEVGVRPCFIHKPQEAERLVWNPECRLNLARYLRDLKDSRVGVVMKGCDGRALVELIKENQVDRRNVFIIAVECNGVYKPLKYGSLRQERQISEYCKRCEVRLSPIRDYVIRSDGFAFNNASDNDEKPLNWLSIFRKCLRCMACIRSCPFCYCTECSIEGFKPALVHKLVDTMELFTFHLTRALHIVGRCVECGACESSCPVEIPLTRLYRELNQWFKENYNYIPGLSLEQAPPPLVFKERDRT